ncbi:unnamed protein product, partial [Laminaria digitata]
MPPHGVAAVGTAYHHALHGERSPPRARSPQTVVPQLAKRPLQCVSSGGLAPALWDEPRPKGSPPSSAGFTSETTADATTGTSSSSTSAAAAAAAAMARPSLCVCKKLAIG